MYHKDFSVIRNANKLMLLFQGIDQSSFDVATNLYYDETGNIKKFIIREESFNVDADTHFVLGGIEGKGSIDFDNLKRRLQVQKSVTEEIKSKHIYYGSFENCLKSDKLELFLDLILDKGWHVHFQSLNILYWSIVDILDSIENIKLYMPFIHELKGILYRVAKYDIKATAKLFHDYKYPDLKTPDSVKGFFQEILGLCKKYSIVCPLQQQQLLVLLQTMLTEGIKQDSATFIQEETELLLIKELTCFYEAEIYTYINSNLFFDNESDIIKAIDDCEYVVDGNVLNKYHFMDSKSDCMIQLSDIFVGIMAKYLHAIDVHIDNLNYYVDNFDDIQHRRFCKLNSVIKSSLDYNQTFIHQTTSIELHTALNKLVEEHHIF